MTEREKMLSGALYRASDPELVRGRARAQGLCQRLGAEAEAEARTETLRELLGTLGEGVEIVPPFQCDYGAHIHIGRGAFVNFGAVILDTCEVRIGEGALLGPGVQLYAATHPTDPEVRRSGLEMGAPITIGRNAWIGGGAIILAGVTVGDDSVVGAGSVVTRSVPPGVLAAGNPCRVIRPLA